MTKKTTLLIDGDLILFRACAAVETEVRWDEDYHVLFSSFEEAQSAVELALGAYFERFGTREHVICLSTGPTFRHALTPTYKSNRAGQRKPLCYRDAVEWLKEHYKVVQFPGLEADDVLGIFASRAPDSTILCSMDKDMKTVPCTLYDGKAVKRIERDEADFWFYYQTLIGDTTDGYAGCPGVGPVTAERALREGIKLVPSEHTFVRGKRKGETETRFIEVAGGANSLWEVVLSHYAAQGLTAEDALLQARLARILRTEDWDAKKKEPILWTPPDGTS